MIQIAGAEGLSRVDFSNWLVLWQGELGRLGELE
jgi:hypothetical protein